jgi:hypothetical protein
MQGSLGGGDKESYGGLAPRFLLSQVSFNRMRKENAGTGQCNKHNDELKHETAL